MNNICRLRFDGAIGKCAICQFFQVLNVDMDEVLQMPMEGMVKRAWRQLPQNGWGKRAWHNMQQAGWGKRALDPYPWMSNEKRAWQKFQVRSQHFISYNNS